MTVLSGSSMPSSRGTTTSSHGNTTSPRTSRWTKFTYRGFPDHYVVMFRLTGWRVVTSAGGTAWTWSASRPGRRTSSSSRGWSTASSGAEVFLTTINNDGCFHRFFWTSGRKCNFEGCDRDDLQPSIVNGETWDTWCSVSYVRPISSDATKQSVKPQGTVAGAVVLLRLSNFNYQPGSSALLYNPSVISS